MIDNELCKINNATQTIKQFCESRDLSNDCSKCEMNNNCKHFVSSWKNIELSDKELENKINESISFLRDCNPAILNKYVNFANNFDEINESIKTIKEFCNGKDSCLKCEMKYICYKFFKNWRKIEILDRDIERKINKSINTLHCYCIIKTDCSDCCLEDICKCIIYPYEWESIRW